MLLSTRKQKITKRLIQNLNEMAETNLFCRQIHTSNRFMPNNTNH